MKKLSSLLLLTSILGIQIQTFAIENQQNLTTNVVPPQWEDYIPTKYQNPRTDFTRSKAIAELSVGIFLTDLLITAPIGIPMTVHSTTKLKNIGYSDKKVKFEAGLNEASKIENLEERQLYYDKLLKDCKMTEKMRKKQAKRVAKQNKKHK